MKKKYLVTNIEKSIQKVMDSQGQWHWLAEGESVIITNPPNSPSFQVEELLPEVELQLEKLKEGTEKLNTKKEVKKYGTRRME